MVSVAEVGSRLVAFMVRFVAGGPFAPHSRRFLHLSFEPALSRFITRTTKPPGDTSMPVELSKPCSRMALIFGSAASIAACAHKPPPRRRQWNPPRRPYAAAPAARRRAGTWASRAPSRARPRTSSSTPATGSTSTPTSTPCAATVSRPWIIRPSGLSRYPRVAIRIEGNCDERGTREYNFALGARRADAVKSYPRLPRRQPRPHHHHLLWQGTAYGRRHGRGGLVA